MRVLFAGGTICNYNTLQRLVLIANEIGFMDRPSVTFGDWGTVGRDSEFRRFTTADAPIGFSVHAPPSGSAGKLYKKYIDADLSNPRFVQTFLDGLRNDPIFQARFIQLNANYGSGTGRDVLNALLADPQILTAPLNEPINGRLMYKTDTAEGRRETLKVGLTEASILVTNALVVSEETKLVPVSDDPYFCRLLAMRMYDSQYVPEAPRFAPFLGLAVAKSILPDQILADLQIQDLFSYRRAAKDAYASWSVEIDKLAARIADIDPDKAEREIPMILNTDIKPKLVEYRMEMKAARDRVFGDLIKKVTRWEMPTLSVACLANLDLASAIAVFTAALGPAVPPVVDYFVKRADIKRRNSMAYLIGLSKGEPDER